MSWAYEQAPPRPVDVLHEAAEVASESNDVRRHMVDAGVLQRVLCIIMSNASEVKGAYPADQWSNSLQPLRARVPSRPDLILSARYPSLAKSSGRWSIATCTTSLMW